MAGRSVIRGVDYDPQDRLDSGSDVGLVREMRHARSRDG